MIILRNSIMIITNFLVLYTALNLGTPKLSFSFVYPSGTYVSIGSTVIIDILGVRKCVSGSAIFVMAFGVAYAMTPPIAGKNFINMK